MKLSFAEICVQLESTELYKSGNYLILAGAPVTCKSSIADHLTSKLTLCKLIQMESFFKINKSQRKLLNLNGFDEVTIDSAKIKNVISSYCNGEEVKFFPYDYREENFRVEQSISNKSNSLVLEGLAFCQKDIITHESCIALLIFFPEDIKKWEEVHIQQDLKRWGDGINYNETLVNFSKKKLSLKKWFVNLDMINANFFKIHYGVSALNNYFTASNKLELEAFLSLL